MATQPPKSQTFSPSTGSTGASESRWEGHHRKGELRGIIKISPEKCVGCDVCTKVCPTHAISGALREKHVIDNETCINCGQCLINCPFGAIDQMSFLDEVLAKLEDPNVLVVAHPAPSVRVSIGEAFGAEPGRLMTAQLHNALEKAGFAVFDVNQAADQTIIEEANEFAKKARYWLLSERGEDVAHMAAHPLPHFTSCCPAWVKRMETFHPELIPHVSTAKPPIPMGGATGKAWAAEHIWKRDPREVYIVSITPCTAKIFESSRPEYNAAWRHLVKEGKLAADTPSFPDIDVSITARELADLFMRKGINPVEMSAERQVQPMEIYTGGGAIFGVSGGVMESALRTAYHALSGQELPTADITAVRGLDNALVEATIQIPVKGQSGKNVDIKVAVVNGSTQYMSDILKKVMAPENGYHFVEVMSCPGGCVNGGGQPIQKSGTAWVKQLKKMEAAPQATEAGAAPQQDFGVISLILKTNTFIRQRQDGLYQDDARLQKSGLAACHNNPTLIQCYKDLNGKPAEGIMEELLHTSFSDRQKQKP